MVQAAFHQMIDVVVTRSKCSLLRTGMLSFLLADRRHISLGRQCRARFFLFLLGHELPQAIPGPQQRGIRRERKVSDNADKGFREMFAILVAHALDGVHDGGGGHGAGPLGGEVMISHGIFRLKGHLLSEKLQRVRLDVGVRVL